MSPPLPVVARWHWWHWEKDSEGGSRLYPGSLLPPARWVRGRFLGRPPATRGLNGTSSQLPGAEPVSLSPAERQTDGAG